MRVCQPGPVAFHRASVSGDNLRLIATFDSGDLGRPRGLSMAAAVRAPKILGKTSFAGRASATIFKVHSGLSRKAFLDLGRFFISLHLSFIGFTQTDDPRFSLAGREHHAVQAITSRLLNCIKSISLRYAPAEIKFAGHGFVGAANRSFMARCLRNSAHSITAPCTKLRNSLRSAMRSSLLTWMR